MSLGLLFWILMLIWLVFAGVGYHWPQYGWCPNLLLFILLLTLGWSQFGAPLHR